MKKFLNIMIVAALIGSVAMNSVKAADTATEVTSAATASLAEKAMGMFSGLSGLQSYALGAATMLGIVAVADDIPNTKTVAGTVAGLTVGGLATIGYHFIRAPEIVKESLLAFNNSGALKDQALALFEVCGRSKGMAVIAACGLASWYAMRQWLAKPSIVEAAPNEA